MHRRYTQFFMLTTKFHMILINQITNSQLGCEILKYMHHKKLHVTRPHSSIKNELQFCLILQHFIKTEIKPLIQMTGHLMILTAFDGLNDIEMKRYQFHINGNVNLILQFYIIFSIFLPIVNKKLLIKKSWSVKFWER